MAQFWYPAETGEKLAAYNPVSDSKRTGGFFSKKIETHANADAPVASDGAPFPVLIFSPEWDGQRWQNTAQAEDLASHGFIVAALDHPYDSALTVLPDGRTIAADAGLAIDFSSDPAYAKFLGNADAHQLSHYRFQICRMPIAR
jgi:hypothetical protein